MWITWQAVKMTIVRMPEEYFLPGILTTWHDGCPGFVGGVENVDNHIEAICHKFSINVSIYKSVILNTLS